MTKFSSRSSSRLTKAGIAVGGFTSLLLVGTAAPAVAAVPGTLSVASGPSGGGNTITMTATNAFTVTPVVEFQAVTATSTGCSTYYKTPTGVTAASTSPYASTAGAVAAVTVTKLTTSKIVITVPSGVALATNQTTSKFYVCAYDSTSTTASTLLANATYSIATAPTITASTGLGTTSGPAIGGNTVTITGTGFIPGATTVTIGGTAATGVTVNAAGTTITATAPSHAPATGQAVVVTTTGGSVNGGSQTYTFANAINVAPNTAPAGTQPTLDIIGAGFGSLSWGTDISGAGIAIPASNGNARIVLTDNSWVQGQTGTSSGQFGNTTTGGSLFASGGPNPIAQCGGILPIADNEVICTLDLTNTFAYASSKIGVTATAVKEGSYQVTVANSDATGALMSSASNYSITSSGSAFTVAPF